VREAGDWVGVARGEGFGAPECLFKILGVVVPLLVDSLWASGWCLGNVGRSDETLLFLRLSSIGGSIMGDDNRSLSSWD